MNGAEQQSLPGIDLDRVTFLSPSALERYRLCPRLYRFLYVDGLWRMSRSSAQQAFGTSVHAALREFYRLPVGPPPDAVRFPRQNATLMAAAIPAGPGPKMPSTSGIEGVPDVNPAIKATPLPVTKSVAPAILAAATVAGSK
jgi:hypothetical protein